MLFNYFLTSLPEDPFLVFKWNRAGRCIVMKVLLFQMNKSAVILIFIICS